jgi:hypothetical protein
VNQRTIIRKQSRETENISATLTFNRMNKSALKVKTLDRKKAFKLNKTKFYQALNEVLELRHLRKRIIRNI